MEKLMFRSLREYIKEKDNREKLYREAQKDGEYLLKKYEETKNFNYLDRMVDNIRKLDELYIDWQDGIKLDEDWVE